MFCYLWILIHNTHKAAVLQAIPIHLWFHTWSNNYFYREYRHLVDHGSKEQHLLRQIICCRKASSAETNCSQRGKKFSSLIYYDNSFGILKPNWFIYKQSKHFCIFKGGKGKQYHMTRAGNITASLYFWPNKWHLAEHKRLLYNIYIY